LAGWHLPTHEISLYFRLISIQVRSQLAYRSSFLLDFLATGITAALAILSLGFVLGRFGNVGGWKFGEIAFLYGLVESAFATMDMVFSGFDPQNFGKQIRLGRLDQVLLRPVSVTLQIFGSEFILRRLGRVLQGLVVLAIALQLVNIQWTALRLVMLPVIFISMLAYFGGLFMIGATISFWTVESLEVINIATYGGTEMMAYPMHIYQDWLVKFFTFVLPAIFLNYYPALFVLGKPDPLHYPWFAPFLAPVAGFGVLAVAFAFWNFGLRHYQSTGT
jgi:ABC-2 type transport system permease protein